LDFQYDRKTARDLPRRPVGQRHNHRMKSRDLFSAEPSLSPQDGPNIVNNNSIRQRLGRAGANEFSAGQRGSAAASQVKYTNSANQKTNRKAASREELLRRREELQKRLAAKKTGNSYGNKLPDRLPGGVSVRSNAKTSNRTFSSTSRTTTVRPKTRGEQKREEYVLKGLWICFSLLLLRLIFMENGVIDYYEMETALEYKKGVQESFIEENSELVKEIKLIKTSPSYQKKLAREHLGVIDRSEFLILFAGPKAPIPN